MFRKNVETIPANPRKPIQEQKLRVAAYCRVSTTYEEQRTSLEAQIIFYTDYIKRNPNWELVVVYSDTAFGIRTKNRPGYQQLIKNCNHGKIDIMPRYLIQFSLQHSQKKCKSSGFRSILGAESRYFSFLGKLTCWQQGLLWITFEPPAHHLNPLPGQNQKVSAYIILSGLGRKAFLPGFLVAPSEAYGRTESFSLYHLNLTAREFDIFALLIGNPKRVFSYETIMSMQIAMTAKLNSGCLSRQVGAVVTDGDYNILSLGWNDAPCGVESCIRRNFFDLLRKHDPEAYSSYELYAPEFRDYLEKINTELVESKSELKGLPLAFCFKDIYQDIIKQRDQIYTRALHGEERALAMCGNERAKGGYLFTTSSPCELCAKKANQAAHFYDKNFKGYSVRFCQ